MDNKAKKGKLKYAFFFKGVPLWVALSAISFLHFVGKKGCPAIPNAAFKISFRPNKKITVSGSISFNDSNKVKSDKQITIVRWSQESFVLRNSLSLKRNIINQPNRTYLNRYKSPVVNFRINNCCCL